MAPIMFAAAACGLGTAGALAWYHGPWAAALSLPVAVLLWAWALIRLSAWQRRRSGIDRDIDRMIDEMKRMSAAEPALKVRTTRKKPPETP